MSVTGEGGNDYGLMLGYEGVLVEHARQGAGYQGRREGLRAGAFVIVFCASILVLLSISDLYGWPEEAEGWTGLDRQIDLYYLIPDTCKNFSIGPSGSEDAGTLYSRIVNWRYT